MQSARRRGLASALSLVLLSGLALASANGASGATVNPQTDRIFVLNNNIENRAVKALAGDSNACDFDFALLLRKSKSLTYFPDIFTVQQVTNQADLNNLIAVLKESWGVDYAGAIATPNPDPSTDLYPGENKGCKSQKHFQSNAVLWRSDRFTKLGQTTWLSDAALTKKGCANLADTYPEQARTKNIAVALTDRKAKRSVVAASIHWPLQPREGRRYYGKFDAHKCAQENMREADEAVEGLARKHAGGAKVTKIVAGDTNARTDKGDPDEKTASKRTWWGWATAQGYKDPIARVCGQTKAEDLDSCRAGKKHITTFNSATKKKGKNRIDFILIKDGDTTEAGALTIDQPEGTQPYSGHMAIRATVKY